jgi:hypothetical protein
MIGGDKLFSVGSFSIVFGADERMNVQMPTETNKKKMLAC